MEDVFILSRLGHLGVWAWYVGNESMFLLERNLIVVSH